MEKITQRIKLIVALSIMIMLWSCSSVNFKKADQKYQQGEYFEAQKEYRKIYDKLKKKDQRSQRAVAAYQLGLCYVKLNQPSRASLSFTNALRMGYPDSILLLQMAETLQKEGKYKDARSFYERFLNFDPGNKRASIGLEGVNRVLANENGRDRVKIQRNTLLLSGRSDYSPFIDPNGGDILYFTSTSEKSEGDVKSSVTGMKNGDIWFSKKDEIGNWTRPQPVDGQLNSDQDEGIVTITPDGNRMYLTRASSSSSNDTRIEILQSRRVDAQWSTPEKLELDIDSVYDYGHPSASGDGKYLYFSSNMPGGYGGYDLWRINLKEDGNYIENLGPDINSSRNEMFPSAVNDSLIYFSSDGHPGFGGLDLFRARLDRNGKWSIENMGIPINSEADDFGITFENERKGFFSSNRKDAKGYDHIYSFELIEPTITVEGYIMDPEEYIIPDAYVRLVGDDGTIKKDKVRNDGSFSFRIEPGVSYAMLASAPDYLNARQEFTAEDDNADATYVVDFILSPINRPIVINNILYDFDRATLREESKASLDSLAVMMKEYPNITIMMISHTDRKGTDAYNDRLSERRAAAVAEYLINNHNLDKERITSKGEGKRVPFTMTPRMTRLYPQFDEGTVLSPEFIDGLTDENDRNDADQINRRTEFIITSTDFYLY